MNLAALAGDDQGAVHAFCAERHAAIHQRLAEDSSVRLIAAALGLAANTARWFTRADDPEELPASDWTSHRPLGAWNLVTSHHRTRIVNFWMVVVVSAPVPVDLIMRLPIDCAIWRNSRFRNRSLDESLKARDYCAVQALTYRLLGREPFVQ